LIPRWFPTLTFPFYLGASLYAVDLTIQFDGRSSTQSSHITYRNFSQPGFIQSWMMWCNINPMVSINSDPIVCGPWTNTRVRKNLTPVVECNVRIEIEINGYKWMRAFDHDQNIPTLLFPVVYSSTILLPPKWSDAPSALVHLW